ncbi:hypothetical protein Enr13x_33200 [Stieleria neptunia]|uniref:Uncharacterized protein n=1 Tax=Stieleria neptunia TaxID=2527979 RepID=A0A518HRI9_9BACT|nr:hypothetical protein [Stieleria neptunia]QDV43463.1 hypothetical protein Enr13x_33200 [Stieleria neptunia]
MSIPTNPYQSPPETVSPDTAERQMGGFGKVCFWAGLAFASLGFLAMFMRNRPPLGFVLIAFAFFVVTWFGGQAYRKRAVVGITLCLVLAGGTLFQMRLMHARLAAERARQQAQQQATAAEQAARAMAESRRTGR